MRAGARLSSNFARCSRSVLMRRSIDFAVLSDNADLAGNFAKIETDEVHS